MDSAPLVFRPGRTKDETHKGFPETPDQILRCSQDAKTGNGNIVSFCIIPYCSIFSINFLI